MGTRLSRGQFASPPVLLPGMVQESAHWGQPIVFGGENMTGNKFKLVLYAADGSFRGTTTAVAETHNKITFTMPWLVPFGVYTLGLSVNNGPETRLDRTHTVLCLGASVGQKVAAVMAVTAILTYIDIKR